MEEVKEWGKREWRRGIEEEGLKKGKAWGWKRLDEWKQRERRGWRKEGGGGKRLEEGKEGERREERKGWDCKRRSRGGNWKRRGGDSCTPGKSNGDADDGSSGIMRGAGNVWCFVMRAVSCRGGRRVECGVL